MAISQNEEVRKIQFSGKSSYTLALPKKWIEDMGLRAGDQITVVRRGDASLLITHKGSVIRGTRGEVTVEVSQKENAGSLVRKLISIYLLGYNVIHVRAKENRLTSAQRDVVKEAARRHLVGTEVIADSTEEITLQVLLSYPELSVENALRRMFLLTSSMHKDAMLALRKFDQDSASGVIKTDDEVDRFSIYVMRQLQLAVQNERILKEIGLATSRDCLGYRLIVKSVERVADHAFGIAQGVLNMTEPLDESILDKITQLSNFALSIFEDSGLALFKRDYGAADKIIGSADLIEDMEKDLLVTMEKGGLTSSYYKVRLIMEDIRRTAEYASDIAEIVLNMTAEQVVIDAGTSNDRL
ncbi:MAG: phosphate uptake regulator PhoU [Thaumarchaeota archaeon]|nr:phosphate uptake regulator PhoU [Nitrososphaerota archaeon]